MKNMDLADKSVEISGPDLGADGADAPDMIWVRGWNGVRILVPRPPVEQRQAAFMARKMKAVTWEIKLRPVADRFDRLVAAREEQERRTERRERARLSALAAEHDEWRPIPGYDGYEASDTGFVRSSHNKKLRAQGVSSSGYISVAVRGGETKRLSAHRAVALAFLPNPENHPHVNHIDLDRSNNRVENLEWVSIVTNQGHTKRLAVEAFERCARIVREHALDYPDNPRVVEALAQCEVKIEALARSVKESIDGDHFALAFERLARRLKKVGGDE